MEEEFCVEHVERGRSGDECRIQGDVGPAEVVECFVGLELDLERLGVQVDQGDEAIWMTNRHFALEYGTVLVDDSTHIFKLFLVSKLSK